MKEHRRALAAFFALLFLVALVPAIRGEEKPKKDEQPIFLKVSIKDPVKRLVPEDVIQKRQIFRFGQKQAGKQTKSGESNYNTCAFPPNILCLADGSPAVSPIKVAL